MTPTWHHALPGAFFVTCLLFVGVGFIPFVVSEWKQWRKS